MEFTPVWLPKSLSVQLWSLRLCGYREFVRTTMEFTPVWLPMSFVRTTMELRLWATDEFVRYNYGVYTCVATDEFVRTTMEFTPVWLPMSLSVQLWSLHLCGYR